jgi:hypothetical protein
MLDALSFLLGVIIIISQLLKMLDAWSIYCKFLPSFHRQIFLDFFSRLKLIDKLSFIKDFVLKFSLLANLFNQNFGIIALNNNFT